MDLRGFLTDKPSPIRKMTAASLMLLLAVAPSASALSAMPETTKAIAEQVIITEAKQPGRELTTVRYQGGCKHGTLFILDVQLDKSTRATFLASLDCSRACVRHLPSSRAQTVPVPPTGSATSSPG